MAELSTAAPDLTPRAAQILQSIVRTYIDTGQPVASGAVSRTGSKGLSAASIRNVMALLEDEGYLSQPHTSAGRLPTEKAFRLFVATLNAGRLLADEIERLRRDLASAGGLADRVERASRILMEMTQEVGIAAAIPDSSQTLDQVELLDLGERRVLMILVTRDKVVRDRVVVLNEQLAQHELTSIRNYINTHFSGWALTQIRTELSLRLEQATAAYDALLRRLNLLLREGLLDLASEAEIHAEGVFNLAGLDLHLTREKLRELFRTLEEKKRILQLLDRFLEQPEGQLGVQVGLGDIHPSMKQLSLIGIRITLPTGLSARFAVLGPVRMNYQRGMSAVLHVSHALRSIPG